MPGRQIPRKPLEIYMGQEVWRDIAGYEGSYQVSNLGRVRSLDREIVFVGRWGNVVRKIQPGKVLALSIGTKGYLGVRLGSKSSVKLVHRLVAAAFIHNSQNMPEVNHKDYIRTNNHINNLEWSTSSENIIHSHAKPERKDHAFKTAVVLQRGEERKSFPSLLSASKFLDRDIGSVSSAMRKGHLCAGWVVEAL